MGLPKTSLEKELDASFDELRPDVQKFLERRLKPRAEYFKQDKIDPETLEINRPRERWEEYELLLAELSQRIMGKGFLEEEDEVMFDKAVKYVILYLGL